MIVYKIVYKIIYKITTINLKDAIIHIDDKNDISALSFILSFTLTIF
jgi:hypothetical protein